MQARASVLKEDDESSEALGRVTRGVVMRERNVEMDAAHFGFSLQYMGPPLAYCLLQSLDHALSPMVKFLFLFSGA
jgi:hypothetical protein